MKIGDYAVAIVIAAIWRGQVCFNFGKVDKCFARMGMNIFKKGLVDG